VRYRTGFLAAGETGHIGNYPIGKSYRAHRAGLQQLFQCGKLRQESLNNIFFDCFSLSLLSVRGDTYVDFCQRYLLTRVAAPCLIDRKKSY